MTPKEEFDNRVRWLYTNIAPDDIYDFAEQAHMAAEYFMARWAESVNLEEVYEKDDIAKIWIRNIVGVRMMREGKLDGRVNTEMRED